MRAGSNIGYCDSEFRNNNTVPNLRSEEDVTNHLESMGFEVNDIRVGDNDLDIYITYNGLSYDFVDFDWDCYESFDKDNYLKEYDNYIFYYIKIFQKTLQRIFNINKLIP